MFANLRNYSMNPTPDNPSDIDPTKTAEHGEKAFKEFRRIRDARFSPTELTNRPIKDLIQTWQKLHPEWSTETSEFFDELYSRLEWAETEVEVFKLRLNKQWTKNSNLYTQKEVDALVATEYSIGYDEGQSAALT